MVKKRLEYACLFGGGAIRGLAHIGVAKALDELGIKMGTLAGSSVGAIVAAALAVGYSYQEIEEIFSEINFEIFKDIDFSKVMALSKGDVFLNRMREMIEQKFYGENYKKGKNKPVAFKDLDKNLIIITTDLNNFTCKEFSKTSTPDFEVAYAVRISCCMPGLMRPVKIDNEVLVDGDLQKSHPMWKLCSELSNLDENILEIRLEGTASPDLKNPLSYLNTVYSCVTAIATKYVDEQFKYDDRHDCLIINTGDVLILDLSIKKDKRKQLMDGGYVQTINYFKKILPQQKRVILDNYIKLNNKITDLKEFVQKDKTDDAQKVYAKICLQFLRNNAQTDEKIKSKIYDLSEQILDNDTRTLILRRKFFKNYKELDAMLAKIQSKINDKITQIESFPWINN